MKGMLKVGPSSFLSSQELGCSRFYRSISHICGVTRGFTDARGLRLDALSVILSEHAIQFFLFFIFTAKKKNLLAFPGAEPDFFCSQGIDHNNLTTTKLSKVLQSFDFEVIFAVFGAVLF